VPLAPARSDIEMGIFWSLSKSTTLLWLDASEWALLLFGILLVVGLIIEYRAEHGSRWMKFGELLVIIGVAGELLGDGGIFLFSRRLQIIADQEIAELTRVSGNAKVSADAAADAASRAKSSADKAQQRTDEVAKQADALTSRMEGASKQLGKLESNLAAQGPRAKLITKAAPGLVKKLAPFAGQRVELFVCGQQGLADQETLDTWGAIANILDSDIVLGVTGAKWKLVPTNLNFAGNCGAAKGLGQGVGVLVSKRASRRTMEAAKVLGHGIAKALPPSPNKVPSLIDPDFAKMVVDRGFQDKNAPWIAPAFDPDLVTVVVGEHP
jgi:hypothetical protein